MSKITENWGLKLLSVVIAFVLWLVVVNIDDPVVSYTHTGVKVDVINADMLASKGKIYEVLNNSDIISVTLIGKRSVIESISKEDIKATADIQDITLMDTVAIKVVTTRGVNKLDAIKSDINAMELSIEDLKEVHLPVNVRVDGNPSSGFIVGDVNTNQNTIKVSGPESVVEQIARAECVINVEGRTTDISTIADIHLLDQYGELIEHKNLTTNISDISVSASVLATKAVDIIYSYSGAPKEGYVVSGDIESDHKAVYIAGKQAVIDKYDVISIPGTAVYIEGKTESYSVPVNLGYYMPDGVRIADSGFDGYATVTVNIEKTVEKTIDVPIESVKFVGVPDGKSVSLNLAAPQIKHEGDKYFLEVQAYGVSGAFEDIDGSEVSGQVNIQSFMTENGLTDLSEGTYTMDATFIMPGNIQAYDDYKISIVITDN